MSLNSPTQMLLAPVIARCIAVVLSAVGAIVTSPALGETVTYNQHVRAILSDSCFQCHGPDAKNRMAGLRLDQANGATAKLESGSRAIVPGEPEASEFLNRIAANDDSLKMPPVESGKSLSPDQVAILKAWIAQGAKYETHWSFSTVQKPVVPGVEQDAWSTNPIDRFVLKKLRSQGLAPAAEASREALARRVSLDLTGLPLSPKETDEFLQDTSTGAYENLVDRLLASERYGEHQARYWLDLARYGDTHGMHGDFYREMWPYRDWVISAFNRNVPFDEFTVAQLAGDLLPDATDEDRVATGFLRCHVTTNEKGVIKEECYVRNVVDRVETVATTWLGLTAGCAACHDHKFDPLTQKEFYSLFAYFNNGTDAAMDSNAPSPAPVLTRPTRQQAQRLVDLDGKIHRLERVLAARATPAGYRDPHHGNRVTLKRRDHIWIDDSLPGRPTQAPINDAHKWRFVSDVRNPVFSGDRSTRLGGKGVTQHMYLNTKAGQLVAKGDKVFFSILLDPKNPPREVMLKVNNGDWEHRAFWGQDLIRRGTLGTASRVNAGPLPKRGEWTRLSVSLQDLGLSPGELLYGVAIAQHSGVAHYDAVGVSTLVPQGNSHRTSMLVWEALQSRGVMGHLPTDIAEIVRVARQQRSKESNDLLLSYFLRNVFKDDHPGRSELTRLKQDAQEIRASIPSTLVYEERKDVRPAYVLNRGLYDQRGEAVQRLAPAFLPPFPKHALHNRLGFAEWLVMPEHPLTARVTANRFWQQCFGTGLVATSEDFGLQGDLPTHPELLNFLSASFIESGWDVKRLLKQIVMSSTYRQSSASDSVAMKRDPENRLLARGPRHRLDAEVIRDSALAASGLLVERIGGPSVKPYQPSGLWQAVSIPTSNTSRFKQDHGDALYRRSLYTFWKRTSPPPSMQVLDAPTRETCVSRRSRTNTPTAALALMNDVQFVEAARKMAEQALQSQRGDAKQIQYVFRLAVGRSPSPREAALLDDLLSDQLEYFNQHPVNAKRLLGIGESPVDSSIPPPSAAAWTIVCNTILNLSETITKN